MENKKDIRALAMQYFAGQLSIHEEQVLFDYIQQGAEQHAEFRQWEKEWKVNHSPLQETNHEWQALQNRIRTQEAIRPLFVTRKTVLWKKVASIAAMLVLVAGVSLLIAVWFSSQRSVSTERYFVYEAPYGGKSKVILSDSTVVWLNAGSILKYSDHFDASNRKVQLSGEGYFEVTKQRGDKLFVVETNGYDVVVRGTKFNVSAYPDDSFITTTLIEGVIDLDYQNKLIRMLPGESTKLDLSQHTIQTLQVDAAQSNAWVEDRIEFDGITLEEMIKKLSRQYDVNIHLSSQKAKATKFRISLRNKETISEVLQALQEVVPITIERKDKDIYIRE